MNDYEVEHEDVVLKLFVQSLIEDARDWYRGMPTASISYWEEFEIFFKEKYGDKINPSFMLNEFKKIKNSLNKDVFDFNIRFQKAMHNLFQVLRLDDNVCLTTYMNAFNEKMTYIPRDKDPQTLRDASRIAINIEGNRRAPGKLKRREDPTFSKNANDKIEKSLGTKPKEEER